MLPLPTPTSTSTSTARPAMASAHRRSASDNFGLLLDAVNQSVDHHSLPSPTLPSLAPQKFRRLDIQALLAVSKPVDHNDDPAQQAKANGKRKRATSDPTEPHDSRVKIRKNVQERLLGNSSEYSGMTTIACYHAIVAQKSYGSEKRFLCPPPIIRIHGPTFPSIRKQSFSLAVISDLGIPMQETKADLGPNHAACFKYLHINSSGRAKHFQLELSITDPDTEPNPDPWARFRSNPITIISKPSKKTARTRTANNGILDHSQIALFNRINSQTVRTKYLTTEDGFLATSSGSWTPFTVDLLPPRPPNNALPSSITYGSRITLRSGSIETAPLRVRKVEKRGCASDDNTVVSQMQKVALMKEDDDGKCWYLSAFGTGDRQPNATLAGMSRVTYQPVIKKQELVDGKMVDMEEVDDYLTWTIVGIAQTQYSFFDAFGEFANPPKLPITHFPTLANQPLYRPAMPALQHSLLLSINDFYYDIHRPNGFSGRQTLEVWVGSLGPLHFTISQQSAPANASSPPSLSDSSAILIVDLPPMQDILQALYDATLRKARPHPRMDGDPGLSTAIHSESSPNGPTGLNGSPAHYDSVAHLTSGESSSHASGAGQNGRTPAAGPSKNKLRQIVPAGAFQHGGDYARASTGRPTDSLAVNGPLTEHRIKAEDPTPKRPTLPLLFIRAADGTGFHSGHVLTCEKMLTLHDSRMMLSPEEQQRVWDDPKAFWKPGDSVTDWQVRIFQQ